MRIRQTSYMKPPSLGGNYTIEVYNSLTGVHENTQNGSVPDRTGGYLSSVIKDQGPVIFGVKECEHATEEFSPKSCVLDEWLSKSFDWRSVQSTSTFRLWDLYNQPPIDLSIARMSVSYPKTVEELRNECLAAFYDTNEVDSLLNLLEAEQLVSGVKGIFDFLTRFKTSVRKYLQGQAGREAFFSRKGIRGKDASDLYLSWNFGFAPLISDLRKISRALPNIRKNLRELARNSVRPYTVTRSCVGTLSYDTTGLGGGYSPITDPSGWWHYQLTPVVAPTRIVGVRGRRHIEYNMEEFQQLDYILSRFIATGPVTTIWEKVPFSFVVDWFIDLTGLLHRLDNTFARSGKKVEKCWTSEKQEINLDAVKHPDNFEATQYDGEVITRKVRKYYHRTSLSPDYVVQKKDRFGKKQFSLLLALFHQMVANLKRTGR